MVRLLPEPWVCQTTPMRRSPELAPPRLRPDSYLSGFLGNALSLRLRIPLLAESRPTAISDGVELVITCHLFDQVCHCRRRRTQRSPGASARKRSGWQTPSSITCSSVRPGCRLGVSPDDGAPGLEPFPPRTEGANAGIQAVGDHQHTRS